MSFSDKPMKPLIALMEKSAKGEARKWIKAHSLDIRRVMRRVWLQDVLAEIAIKPEKTLPPLNYWQHVDAGKTPDTHMRLRRESYSVYLETDHFYSIVIERVPDYGDEPTWRYSILKDDQEFTYSGKDEGFHRADGWFRTPQEALKALKEKLNA